MTRKAYNVPSSLPTGQRSAGKVAAPYSGKRLIADKRKGSLSAQPAGTTGPTKRPAS